MTKFTDDTMGKIARQQNDLFLTVDYGVRPYHPWFLNLDIVEHPNRTDVATIDPVKVDRVLTLREGEDWVGGEENLRRLKERVKETGEILLDARVMEELWKHPHLIPEGWKDGVTYFWGTIFRVRGSGDVRGVPCLFWRDGRWDWLYDCLECDWHSNEPAAVLRK